MGQEALVPGQADGLESDTLPAISKLGRVETRTPQAANATQETTNHGRLATPRHASQ